MSVQATPPTFCCRADNDLYQALVKSGRRPPRVESPVEAIAKAPEGSGVLLLADGYPAKPTILPQDLLDEAARKRLRLFAEYALLPGQAPVEPRQARWERVVVADGTFGEKLPALRILTVHAAKFLPVEADGATLVMGRVAGFDTAVFGLPKTTWPLLYRRGLVVVATTKLSNFVTGRFGPSAAWQVVWENLLAWLGDDKGKLKWTPSVRPTYGPDKPLPADAEKKAVERALRWFENARLLIAPSWQEQYDRAGIWPDRVVPPQPGDREVGDGSLGVLEGFSSTIDADGGQPMRWWVRADVNGEAALAFALGNERQRRIGANLADFLLFHSIQSQGERANPACDAYGLIGWNNVARYWGALDGYGVYYGDDNARAMLGIMGAAAALGTDRWDSRLLACLLGNLRTTGKLGYRLDRIDEPDLEKNGWRHYWNREVVNEAPHFE